MEAIGRDDPITPPLQAAQAGPGAHEPCDAPSPDWGALRPQAGHKPRAAIASNQSTPAIGRLVGEETSGKPQPGRA